MPQIRVWNDNTLPYEEKFGDLDIKILPGKFLDMEADDATRFCGTYRQPLLDGMGNPKRESMKMLRKEFIEPLFDDGTGSFGKGKTEFKCEACGKVCVDQEHLDGHVAAQHLNQLADSTQTKRNNRKR